MSLKNLYPGRMVSSVYEMDWEKLALTYRGVIFDIDNTLVPHGAPEERVRPFAEEVESIYLYKAGKPKRDGYEKAMQRMGTDTENTLFVGDQIFTDIFGGNRAGLDTVLTEPIDKSTDEPQIVVKRWFEKPFRKVRRDF